MGLALVLVSRNSFSRFDVCDILIKTAGLGRFFAATEIKVVLVHLLMNYDIDVDPEFGSPVHMVRDGQEQINPLARLRYRKREAEIDTTRVV